MNDQDQLDPKTLRYISENAEIEHAILTPFRWLMGLGKLIIGIILAAAWLGFTLCGWMVNVGEYSLENRREAVCDARAYVHICDLNEFNETHPHTDYGWDFSRVVKDDTVGNVSDVHTVGDGVLVSGSIDRVLPEEEDPTARPWISFGDREFFMRGNDVFRRKSRQMDEAVTNGAIADEMLIFVISEAKGVDETQVRLPDAPKITIRQGVMPANAISSKGPVTWGMCLKQECAADGSDLNYALFWGDVMWTRPVLGQHQKNAVDALRKMGTLSFWLQEAHANGVHNDALIQKGFQEHQQQFQ